MNRPGRNQPGGLAEGDTTPIFDQAFDAGSLGVLRAEVKAHAGRAGLPEARAEDVVLAVHELAANAVRHGPGAGRLRMWKIAGALRCQVHDGDTRAAEDTVARPAGATGNAGPGPANSLPSRPGHGLWVVRQIADWMQVRSGARGTRVTVTFDLPGRPPLRCSPAM
jgi:two-component sensor histidine kinase